MPSTKSAAHQLGRLESPEPVASLAARRWDVIVVGAGHNGLSCAAYLARAGRSVLVLEARERIGGACTAREIWPGYKLSPCAYLCGLLHPRVITDLELERLGFEWMPAASGMFVPFDDGSSIQLWEDDDRCDAEIKRFAPSDLKGWHAFSAFRREIRDALRPPDDRDLWLHPAPARDEIESRLGHDKNRIAAVFQWSMAELLEQFLTDERLISAMLGQGVIGTFASPLHPGTASVHLHHNSGRQGGMPGTWGYVKGGMGTVSFLLCDAARQFGAVVATGLPVARIEPGRGVQLDAGDWLHAPVVVSNADPRVALRLLGDHAEPSWRRRVESIPIEGCTLKMNVALRELPNFTARPGTDEPHHRGQVNTPLTAREWADTYLAARAGRLPERLWTELYFHTAYDETVAPQGVHTMSVFAQHVPNAFAPDQGTWDSRREDVGDLALAALARHCTNIPEAILLRESLGPPDVEREVGLTGGHIFQGEMLPAFMWSNRLGPQSPMPGFYLCGAATYPGGSVMAVNGRNAALAILKSTR